MTNDLSILAHRLHLLIDHKFNLVIAPFYCLLLQLDYVGVAGPIVNVFQELLQGFLGSLSFSFDLAIWCVFDEAGQTILLSAPLSECSEVDALHRSMHSEGDALRHVGGSWAVRYSSMHGNRARRESG